MKRLLLLFLVAAPTMQAATGFLPVPHIQHSQKAFKNARAGGLVLGAGGTIAELDALNTETQIARVQKNIARNERLYKKSQGTEREITKAAFQRRDKKYKRQEARLLENLKKAQRVANIALIGQELAAVRNNWAERPFGAVAQGLTWDAPTAPSLIGKLLPLRYLLTVLDGVLSMARHVRYQSPNELAWMTAAQRTSRLFKMFLRHGIKNVPKRVIASYVLQLIGVGLSFVGNVRENVFCPNFRNAEGAFIDPQSGQVIISADGTVGNLQLWHNLPGADRERILQVAIDTPSANALMRRIRTLGGSMTGRGYNQYYENPNVYNAVAVADADFSRNPQGGVIQNGQTLSTVEAPEGDRCVVCIEPYAITGDEPFGDVGVQLPCDHLLHHACAQGMRSALESYQNLKCPVCRANATGTLNPVQVLPSAPDAPAPPAVAPNDAATRRALAAAAAQARAVVPPPARLH